MNRRRAKESELDVSLPADGEEAARESRNLGQIFPFVGGDRGKKDEQNRIFLVTTFFLEKGRSSKVNRSLRVHCQPCRST